MSSNRKGLVLAVVCAAAFTINVDTTLVNVTLPTLVRELNASTTELQWIVDAYNLTFAAFVLAAGSLSDKFGRKGALLTGLALFGVATAAGSFATTSGQLIAARAVMGVGAAIVFPNTLSIISNVFTDRAERAKAIGAWGGVTGVSIALGPITGGWLLEHFWWGSAFLAMAPVAAVAVVLVALVVPNSRDPQTPPLDYRGLVLSTLTIASLVYTIIESPQRGWTSPASLTGFAIAAAALWLFVRWERRTAHPMLDVTLFANLRFSAASGAVTVAFFALFGFTFLITMYFQFLRGYGPLSTGLRILPVALAVGFTSVTGTRLAVRFGNRAVVSTGLLLMGVGFAWISTASIATSYLEIVGQMLVVGAGVGLTSAPATEAIMGVVPKEKAGVGSAVNDATRELGGTLGVAVIGSVFASIYIRAIEVSQAAAVLPAELIDRAKDSVGSAFLSAEAIAASNPDGARLLKTMAEDAYFNGFAVGCLVAAGVALVGAAFVARYLPSRPVDDLPPNLPAQRSADAVDVVPA